jgi:hypothetical protein
MNLSAEVMDERRYASVIVRRSVMFKNVDEFEFECSEEQYFGRSGMEVRMNE